MKNLLLIFLLAPLLSVAQVPPKPTTNAAAQVVTLVGTNIMPTAVRPIIEGWFEAGNVTTQDVESAISARGYTTTNDVLALIPSGSITTQDVENVINAKGYTTTNDVLDLLAVTGTNLLEQLNVAQTNLQAAINAEAVARAAGDAVSLTNWQAVVYSMTNGAALGATALQASWASTGTVAHAVTAGRIAVAGDADYWLTVCGGTGTLWRVSDDTNSIRVVSVSEDFTANGITPGLVITPIMTFEEFPNIVFWGNTSGSLAVQFWRDMSVFEIYDADVLNWFATASDLPATLYRDGSGSCVIDWGKTTNSYALATLADVAALPTFPALNASNAADRAYADAAIASHNTNGTAHADIRAMIGPTNGCTELAYAADGTNVTITGATYSYFFAPDKAYTLSVAPDAPRYHYSIEIIGDHACTLPAGHRLRGEWTITGTNEVVVAPSTGTVWNVFGRGL